MEYAGSRRPCRPADRGHGPAWPPDRACRQLRARGRRPADGRHDWPASRACRAPTSSRFGNRNGFDRRSRPDPGQPRYRPARPHRDHPVGFDGTDVFINQLLRRPTATTATSNGPAAPSAAPTAMSRCSHPLPPFPSSWEFAVAMNRSVSCRACAGAIGVRCIAYRASRRQKIARYLCGFEALFRACPTPGRPECSMPFAEGSWSQSPRQARQANRAAQRNELRRPPGVGEDVNPGGHPPRPGFPPRRRTPVGRGALRRIGFMEATPMRTPTRLTGMFQGLRHGDSASPVDSGR